MAPSASIATQWTCGSGLLLKRVQQTCRPHKPIGETEVVMVGVFYNHDEFTACASINVHFAHCRGSGWLFGFSCAYDLGLEDVGHLVY